MTREIFIPVGRGEPSEVYVDGAAYVAKFINFERGSTLQNQAGQSMKFSGDELRAIIAKDERNHKYYTENKPQAEVPSPQPKKEAKPSTIAQTSSNRLDTIDYSTLMKQEYAPLKFQVDKILPQGIFILAGAPKIGKSWLVLDICHSIAAGNELWERNTTQNGVLYIALEDNHRRLQDRLKKIIQEELPTEPLNLHLAVSAKGIHDGLMEQIDSFMAEHPDTGFIAIDTLEHIRKGEVDRKDRGLYSTDYADMQILRAITNKYDGITLMLIHHTRKMYDADPLFTVTGSTGLTGAVDGIWVLDKEKRADNKAVLSILNRDTKGYAFKLQLDEVICKWQFLGECEQSEQDDKERLAVAINKLFTQNDLHEAEEWKGNATALWTKRVKDKSLVGTVKERINQVSHSKKWWTRKKLDENGDVVYKTDKQGNIKLNKDDKPKPELESAYSGLQDRIYQHMTDAGFPALTRGIKGSRKKHLHHMEFKAQEEAEMARVWEMFVETDKKTLAKLREEADKEEKRIRVARIDASLAEDKAKMRWVNADEALEELNEAKNQTAEAYDELHEVERLIEETKAPLHEAQLLNPQAVKMAMEKIVADYREQERKNARMQTIKVRSQDIL